MHILVINHISSSWHHYIYSNMYLDLTYECLIKLGMCWQQPPCAWFLETALIYMSVCVCLPQRALITSGVICFRSWTVNLFSIQMCPDNLNTPTLLFWIASCTTDAQCGHGLVHLVCFIRYDSDAMLHSLACKFSLSKMITRSINEQV